MQPVRNKRALSRASSMGARGKARREELGITKDELAKSLKVTRQRVVQMEAEGIVHIDGSRRWAEALQMDVAELMFGEPSFHGSGGVD